jgi:hypothetical protein
VTIYGFFIRILTLVILNDPVFRFLFKAQQNKIQLSLGQVEIFCVFAF